MNIILIILIIIIGIIFREILLRKAEEIDNLVSVKQELQNENNIIYEKNEKYQELLVNEKNLSESTKQSKIETEK